MKRRAGAMLSLVLCAGCCHPFVPTDERKLYTGPTVSLDEVVARVDANNVQIPTLWARQDFDGTIVDDKHNSHSLSARGVLLYRAPHELRIVANDDFGGPIFELGATDEFYWLKVVPQDTLWWGRMQNAGKPGSAAIPIRPDLILDVLGVGMMDTNLAREPFPVMRFDNAADEYVVDTIRRGPDRLLLQKEVWYDRQTFEPLKVLLFDANGRETLRATLGATKPLPIDGAPKIATHYRLFFPDSGSVMEFTLSEQALTKNGLPHAGTIHLPDLNNPGVKNVIQIDRDVTP